MKTDLQMKKTLMLLLTLLFWVLILPSVGFSQDLHVKAILGKEEIVGLFTETQKKQPISAKDTLKPPMRLDVPKGTSAILQESTGDFTLWVREGTQLEYAGSSFEGVQKYVLFKGSVWFDIRRKMQLELVAPLAVVSIRGTEFGVSAGEGYTSVYVLRGSVWVTLQSGKREVLGPGQSLSLSANDPLLEKARTSRVVQIESPTLPSVPAPNPFFGPAPKGHGHDGPSGQNGGHPGGSHPSGGSGGGSGGGGQPPQ